LGGSEEILCTVYTSAAEKELKPYFQKGLKPDMKVYKEPIPGIADTSRNFLLLRHKLTLNAGKDELAIIRYTQYIDSVAGKEYTIQVLRQGNQRKIAKLAEYQDVDFVMLSVSTDEFWSLHKKDKLDEHDKAIPHDIISKVKDDGGVLNLTKLAAVIRERKKQGKGAVN
jgi:hypothetical protein